VDEDDAPIYVDEGTNETLSKAEYEALVATENAAKNEDVKKVEHAGAADLVGAEKGAANTDGQPDDERDDGAAESLRQKQSVTEAGKTSKKRKAIKAVGAVEDAEDAHDVEEKKKQLVKRPKSKAKAVVLSFAADGED